jgi:hypothetical protein
MKKHIFTPPQPWRRNLQKERKTNMTLKCADAAANQTGQLAITSPVLGGLSPVYLWTNAIP